MAERVYCSEQNAHESMIGTADQVDVWILLEYKPAWTSRAVEDNALDPATRRWLDDNLAALAQAGMKGRPQFIRQPEIDHDEIRLLVGVSGRLLQFSGRGYGFLREVSLPAVGENPSAFPALERPHYFVCTNGQRDLCCARFGLPTYAALRERVSARAWQATHLGGHRFAPNVLVLPQGALYGRVTADSVGGFVDAVEAGGLAFPQLRGRSRYPAPAQAAEALSGRSDLELVRIEGDDDRARVTFEGPQGPMSLAVRQADQPLEVLKSCGDEAPKPVRPYLPG